MTDREEKASGQAQLFTFTLLHEAAHYALNAAKSEGAKSQHFCLLSLVSGAFCLEAFLNEFGERRLGAWEPPERKPPRWKLDQVCTRLGLAPDFDDRPFSSFTWLMEFRNSVAHGRTEVIAFHEVPISPHELGPVRPPSTIEQACSLRITSEALADVRAMIDLIGQKAGLAASPLMMSSLVSWVSTPTE